MPLHSWEHTPGAQALAVSTDGGAVFGSLSARETGDTARWASTWGARISSGDFTNGSTTNNSVAVAGSTAGIAPHCGTSSAYGKVGRYCTYVFAMRINV